MKTIQKIWNLTKNIIGTAYIATALSTSVMAGKPEVVNRTTIDARIDFDNDGKRDELILVELKDKKKTTYEIAIRYGGDSTDTRIFDCGESKPTNIFATDIKNQIDNFTDITFSLKGKTYGMINNYPYANNQRVFLKPGNFDVRSRQVR